MCNAVRENFERAEFVGYNPQLVRFFAFCLSGFFAGIAGARRDQLRIVNSGYVGAEQSGSVLLAAYIGGIGFFGGPDHRRDPRHLAAGHAQRHHRGVAALFRPSVRRHGQFAPFGISGY